MEESYNGGRNINIQLYKYTAFKSKQGVIYAAF